MSILIQILLLGFLLILSGFFSSAEVAYTGLTLKQLKRLRRSHPGMFAVWERSPDRVLATLLLSNNGVNIAVGVVAAHMAWDLSKIFMVPHSVANIGISILFGTVLLVFGEILPKIWAQRHTISWAIRVTPPLQIWGRILRPLSQLGVSVSRILLRRGFRGRHRLTPFLHRSELRRILLYSHIPMGSRKLLTNAIEFQNTDVESIMIPREKIETISLNSPMDKIIQHVIQSGYSRLPVITGSVDHVAGLLYSKDLLVAWRSGQLVLLQDLLRPIQFVSVDTPLPELLRLFRAQRQHMALVKDNPENNKVVGLVTLQDALEALVGYIKDEDI